MYLSRVLIKGLAVTPGAHPQCGGGVLKRLQNHLSDLFWFLRLSWKSKRSRATASPSFQKHAIFPAFFASCIPITLPWLAPFGTTTRTSLSSSRFKSCLAIIAQARQVPDIAVVHASLLFREPVHNLESLVSQEFLDVPQGLDSTYPMEPQTRTVILYPPFSPAISRNSLSLAIYGNFVQNS